MSYVNFYKSITQRGGDVAETIRNNAKAGKVVGSDARRGSGIVRRPRTKDLDGGVGETAGGGFAGGFARAFNASFGTSATGSIEADKPTGSGENRFGEVLNQAMGMLKPQINTSENRAAAGNETMQDVENQRRERVRADFHNHLENGGTVKEFDWMKYNYSDGTIRNKPISDKLIKDMSFLKDMGVQMVIYSGGQTEDRRTGGYRHNDGNAADVYFVDKASGKVLDWSDPKNKALFQEIFYRGYRNGVQGWGAHKDYMGTERVHLGYGTPAVWGAGGTGRPAEWLWEAWNNARAGNIPELSNAPASLVQSESTGRWDATNDADGAGGEGHFGRVQFSRARLQEAKEAGAIPADMTPEQFLRDKDAQISAENWHFQDIRNFIKRRGLDKYIGQTINGVKVTMDGMIAVAHLGGQTGLLKHLTSGGTYNPSDSYIDKKTGQRVKGNTLSDYMRKHMA